MLQLLVAGQFQHAPQLGNLIVITSSRIKLLVQKRINWMFTIGWVFNRKSLTFVWYPRLVTNNDVIYLNLECVVLKKSNGFQRFLGLYRKLTLMSEI